MVFGKLVAALLGLGAAGAKSSIDLRRKDQSPEAQQGWAEYEYLYGKVPTRKGYNRVLEFDVINARIRDDLKEIAPLIDKYFLLLVSVELNTDRYTKLCSAEWHRRISDPNCDPDIKRWRPLCVSIPGSVDMDYANAIGWFQWLEETNQTDMRGKSRLGDDFVRVVATRKAQDDMFKQKYHSFSERGYRYHEMLLELGRKTAYDNGYLPSCQNSGRNRWAGYSELYCGKIHCDWEHYINWETGIPNQTARRKLAERDATGQW